jgi:hypothetical protein
MKNKFKMMIVSTFACIPLLAQATSLVDSQNINKQLNNTNTGTVTIKACAPYPLCKEEIQSSQSKDKQEKTKKKPK